MLYSAEAVDRAMIYVLLAVDDYSDGVCCEAVRPIGAFSTLKRAQTAIHDPGAWLETDETSPTWESVHRDSVSMYFRIVAFKRDDGGNVQ